MKKRSFFTGVLCTLIVISMIGTGFAITGKVTQEVQYNNIGVILDGKRLDLRDSNGNSIEPFMYNNTNYLPVRAVAEALGLEVSFDNEKNAVVLTSDSNQQNNNLPSESTNYSRTNPAPAGVPQTVTVDKYWGSYTATVQVNTVWRGDIAWLQIRHANQFNKAPSDGKEYILTEIKVTIDKISDDRSINVSGYDFTAFSSDNAEYKKQSTVDPSRLLGDAYEGGTITGWVSFLVDKNDPAPKIVYGSDLKGTGGIWFSLDETK